MRTEIPGGQETIREDFMEEEEGGRGTSTVPDPQAEIEKTLP